MAKSVKIKSVLVGEQSIPTSDFSGVSYVRLTIETKTTRKITFLFLSLLYSCREVCHRVLYSRRIVSVVKSEERR